MTCVLCCAKFESKDSAKKLPHSWLGRTTTKFSSRCKVVLCMNCHDKFHKEVDLSLPSCLLQKLGIKRSPIEWSAIKRDLLTEYDSNESDIEINLGFRNRKKDITNWFEESYQESN